MRHLPCSLLIACTTGPAVPEIAVDPSPPAHTADATAGVSYKLSFSGSSAQLMSVEAVFPNNADQLELFMASWTPGSYRIRDYAQHVEQLHATDPDGTALRVEKTRPNAWTVHTLGAQTVVLRYEVLGVGTSVRDNIVEPDFAVLNGAPSFITARDRLDTPHDVRLELPDSWPHAVTALAPAGEPGRFRAQSYDELVDSPMLLGSVQRSSWSLDDVPHELAHLLAPADFPMERAAADVERITRQVVSFWGGMPFRDFTLMNVWNEGRGGLEHKQSALMFATPDIAHDEDAWRRWLGLVAHEYFHAWNVKRLRPVELGPFDYEQPNLTRSLWIAEGLTTYYADLMLVRAGLLTESQYLERLAHQMSIVQRQPGREIRSLEDASVDAWIKYYQPDAHTANTSVDYYAKGAVVGFLLDARIRAQSRGWASLDDAMRLAYARYSQDQGFTAEGFQEVCEEVAGGPLDDFFSEAVRGTTELSYEPALALYGLQLTADSREPRRATLGLEVSGGRVTTVQRNGPAWSAGILVGDEILALDGRRLRDLQRDLRGKSVDQEIDVLLSRRNQLRSVRVVPTVEDAWSTKITLTADASIEARSTRAQWLGQPRPGSPEARALARAAQLEADTKSRE